MAPIIDSTRVFAAILAAAVCASPGCRIGSPTPEVVVYVSVDQVHAEPVLHEFERRSGITVRAVFDVEASKTTGLANRLVAEKSRPQADVFWNGEFVQTLRLKSEGALMRSHPRRADPPPANLRDHDEVWHASGARFRVILANTDRLEPASRPTRLEDFASDKLPARDLAMALPLFGTSAAQSAALYASLGAPAARAFYLRLRDRGVKVVAGNSVVRDLVVQGAVAAGLTDSDDACGALTRGAPVALIVPDQEGPGTLLIPGTVAQVAGAPHAAQALALIEFLLAPDTEKRLIDSGFFQGSVRGGVTHPCLGGRPVRAMPLTLGETATQLDASRHDMTALFAR